jgi:NAD(P)-dependent dehydrogenase (short-subunit alcohol dehydrogenase family)
MKSDALKEKSQGIGDSWSVFRPQILAEQHAVITGGGSGIGLRMAQRFSQAGAKVSIISRNLSKCEQAAEAINAAGGNACASAADVRDDESLSSAFEQAVRNFGPVDICIAGAAGNFVAAAGDMSSKGFRTVIDIDLVGTYNTFRAARNNVSSEGANFIAISAVQSNMPSYGQAHVCAAKAGIDMLIRCLSIEWASCNIRCNAIAPGPVLDTEGMNRLAHQGEESWHQLLQGIPMRRAAKKDEIADLALFLCSGAASYIHGTVIAIDGGQSNIGSKPFGDMLKTAIENIH